MPFSNIYILDAKGNINHLCSYSLDPKQAIIAHYMQNVRRNFNTADYPSELSNIIPRPSGKGYSYLIDDDTFISGPDDTAIEPVYSVQDYGVHYELENITLVANVYRTDTTELTQHEIIVEAEGYLKDNDIFIAPKFFVEIETREKTLARDAL